MSRLLSYVLAGLCVGALSARPGVTLAGEPASQPAPGGKSSADMGPPRKVWFRLLRVDIPTTSPARENKKLNHPPNIYLKFLVDGADHHTTSNVTGWTATFPDDHDANQVLVTEADSTEYSFQVWDSQWWKNQQIFSIGPIKGSKLCRLADANSGTPKEVALADDTGGGSVVLQLAGVRAWYRLKNVTIPPESPHRKLEKAPILAVKVKLDGKYLGAESTEAEGWAVDFPDAGANRWPVRLGGPARYCVEVWDMRGTNKQLFSVANLAGDAFDAPIEEQVDHTLGGKSTAAVVRFVRSQVERD